MEKLKKSGRKVIVALIGFPVVIAGVIMLVTPGPGLLVIAAGLAILALEFAFASRYLNQIKKRVEQLDKKVKRKKNNT